MKAGRAWIGPPGTSPQGEEWADLGWIGEDELTFARTVEDEVADFVRTAFGSRVSVSTSRPTIDGYVVADAPATTVTAAEVQAAIDRFRDPDWVVITPPNREAEARRAAGGFPNCKVVVSDLVPVDSMYVFNVKAMRGEFPPGAFG